MDRFVHRENLAHYRRLLAEPDVANDRVRHKVLVRLLADEQAKEAIPMNTITGQGFGLRDPGASTTTSALLHITDLTSRQVR
jgi:hypothetical protein